MTAYMCVQWSFQGLLSVIYGLQRQHIILDEWEVMELSGMLLLDAENMYIIVWRYMQVYVYLTIATLFCWLSGISNIFEQLEICNFMSI